MGKNRIVRKGEIWLVNLDPVIGSETTKTRPAIIVQNNAANKYSPRTVVVPLTSKKTDSIYPGEFLVDANSKAMCDQIKAVDKQRLIKKIGELDTLWQLNEALEITFDI